MNTAERLGFSKDSKLLIIHADDAGLAYSENQATIQSLKFGMVNSYSMMVPCPFFSEIADFAIRNPHFDHGIHLTLTCEWETYKFGPVLPISDVPSLVHDKGHFFKKREDLQKNANPKDVEKELKAQIEKALAAGLEPTHLDSHMYSVGADPEFFHIYKKLGTSYDLPVLISDQLLTMVGLDPVKNIEKNDFLVDQTYVAEYKFYESGKLASYYSSVLENLTNGINLLLIHPAFDDEEMKNVTVDHPNFGSEWRQIDFDFFTNPRNKSKLNELNIELITWKDIKELQKKL
jgi:predicted glycoside hydrolase/deacetylase ChbG (UPF0249 family)